MIRIIAYVIMLAAAVGVAGWFTLRPGTVAIEWLGWQIEAPVGVFAVAILLFALLVAGFLWLWNFVVDAPGRLRARRARLRRERSYQALSRGMVAVAAGDTETARQAARRAGNLVADSDQTTPLALLLAAQTAQLDGDERAAERSFTAMLARPDTEFLGLRGLLAQAARSGDRERALLLAKRAHALRPDTPWVLTTLFDLLVHSGDWRGAEDVIARAERKRVLPAARARRHQALLAHLQSRQAEQDGQAPAALNHARKAHRLAPDLPPLTAHLVRLALAENNRREAVKAIEVTWPLAPHPDLYVLYVDAIGEADPLKAYGRVERLARLAPEHVESRLALARAAIAARLWGAARSQLQAATGEGSDPPARVWRLFAELEEAEHGDEAAARRALERAAFARPDEAWTCRECGARALDWTALCAACGTFDSLDWTSPGAVIALGMQGAGPEPHGEAALTGSTAQQPAIQGPSGA